MDRVERAWIEHVLTLDRPLFALARVRRATLLLDRDGLLAVARHPEVGPARVLDRLRGRSRQPRARAEGLASRRSIARWRGVPDSEALAHHIGPEPRYLSVGHAGLDARGLGAMSALDGARSAVLIHDTIPLDLPETQKAGATERFRQKIGWVARSADIVFAPLQSTAVDVKRHLSALGWEGTLLAPPLGVTPPVPGRMPDAVPTDRPFFLALGTIEPRKNHGFLLDLWESLPPGPDKPRLVIAGRRGWRNDAVFRRLNALGPESCVIEVNDLADSEVAALLGKARALLFPSLAEGFGFPPCEAAAIGTPVIASPLPQTREVLGDAIIYAEPGDLYQWREAIGDLVEHGSRITPPRLPDWQTHFNGVLSSLG